MPPNNGGAAGRNQSGSDDDNAIDPTTALQLQHLFLQSFLSRPSLTYEQAEAIYVHCAKLVKHPSGAPFSSFIDTVGVALETIGFEIKRARDQATGTHLIVLVNSMADEVSKLATEFTPQEITYFRVIVRSIMTAQNRGFHRSLTEILRVASDEAIRPVLLKSAAQSIVRSLIAKGWLNISPSRILTLSTRTLLELATYLKEEFGDFEVEEGEAEVPLIERIYVDCETCSTGVITGWACPNAECDLRFHRHCVKNAIPVTRKCPGCNTEWLMETKTDPKTRAVISRQIIGLRLGPSDADLGSLSNLKEDDVDADEGEDEDDEQDQSAGQRSQAKPQRKAAPNRKPSGLAKRRGKQSVDSEEEEEEDEDEMEED